MGAKALALSLEIASVNQQILFLITATTNFFLLCNHKSKVTIRWW